MKIKTIQSAFFVAFFLGSAVVGYSQTTWDFGGTPTRNWSTLTNWSTDADPTGTAVIFGSAGSTTLATTVSNIVDANYSISSLLYNGNSATNWQVTQIASPQTLTVGGAFTVGGLSGSNTQVAFTGTGSLVINNSGSTMSVSNTAGSTSLLAKLDMSALSNFSATLSAFNIGTGTTGFGTVYLADTSTITASTMSSGGSGTSYGSGVTNKLYLGTTTTLNVGSLSLAGNRTFGTVKFRGVGDGAANNTAVSGGTLKIRAADGISASSMTVGAWSGAYPASGTSSVDLTGGTVDAKVTTLKVGTISTNNSASTGSASLTIDSSASLFDASGLVTIGETAGGTSGTINGTLNVKGGATFNAGSMTLANQSAGAMLANGTLNISDVSLANTKVDVAGNLTMGVRSGTAAVSSTVNVSGGTLTVGGTVAEGTGGANITSAVNLSGTGTLVLGGTMTVDTFTFTGGTLQLGKGGTTGALATSLAINSGVNAATFTINRSNAVVQGTDFSSGPIAGALSFIQAGTGTTTLNAVNSYTGTTTVSAGTLLVNGSLSGTSSVTVASGASLGGNGTIFGVTTFNGTLRPGNSIDTLNIANNVTWNGSSGNEWEFELGASDTANLLNITGDLLKGTGSLFAFNFLGAAQTGTFKLIDWTGTTSFSATDFSYINMDSGYSGTFSFNGTQLDLTVVAVPEPSTYAMFGVGLLGLVALRRFRRKA